MTRCIATLLLTMVIHTLVCDEVFVILLRLRLVTPVRRWPKVRSPVSISSSTTRMTNCAQCCRLAYVPAALWAICPMFPPKPKADGTCTTHLVQWGTRNLSWPPPTASQKRHLGVQQKIFGTGCSTITPRHSRIFVSAQMTLLYQP